MEEIISITLLIAILIIVFFFIWYFKHQAKSKERLLLIEKGIETKDLDSITNYKINFQWLRIGIVSVGIALGSILVNLILNRPSNFGLHPYNDGPLKFGIILLFAGISMIIANFVGGTKK